MIIILETIAPSEEVQPTLGPWIGFEPVRLETPRTPKHAWFHCTTVPRRPIAAYLLNISTAVATVRLLFHHNCGSWEGRGGGVDHQHHRGVAFPWGVEEPLLGCTGSSKPRVGAACGRRHGSSAEAGQGRPATTVAAVVTLES
ncbi:hypothetical protein E2C01_042283 [Portunus trituberculatus]|uniref:Uncharacterized protein n=1 Tax=Portunus trituberculatus TaxID=210409 RepID=A0A5B7FT95_PORTR|nr:hypothetical protein [Portunus trituberculatus]